MTEKLTVLATFTVKVGDVGEATLNHLPKIQLAALGDPPPCRRDDVTRVRVEAMFEAMKTVIARMEERFAREPAGALADEARKDL